MIAYRLYDIGIKPRLDAALVGQAWLATPRTIGAIVTMFCLNLYGFMTFRCSSLAQIVDMTASLGSLALSPDALTLGAKFLLLTAPVILLDYLEYRKDAEELATQSPLVVQMAVYAAALLLFLMIGQYDGASFIYCQF
jgi:hypothetical protein